MKPATWPGTDIPISRNNGFDWLTGEPSIFAQDAAFNRSVKTSQLASESVEATRAKGTGPSYIFGVSQSTVQMLSKLNHVSIDPEPQQSADKTQRILKGGI
jgi:hypothetical protein